MTAIGAVSLGIAVLTGLVTRQSVQLRAEAVRIHRNNEGAGAAVCATVNGLYDLEPVQALPVPRAGVCEPVENKKAERSSAFSDEDPYDLACVHSLTEECIRDDARQSADRRARLVEAHVSRALRWAEATVNTAHFERRGTRDGAITAPDLTALRDRVEFRAPIRAFDEKTVVRGVLVRIDRLTAEFVTSWKTRGATSIVVPLDEKTKKAWDGIARTAQQVGMSLWPWVEVARNGAMADAHPEWMAAPGGHHDDWRRRFPQAPKAKAAEVIKAWPWVPIGYAPAFDAHRARLKALLADLPGHWSGVFLNDLQAGPSSCGCGNDQCRWALDYGSPPTAAKRQGDAAAASIVSELRSRHPGKAVVPVWVTECEPADLPDAKDGTGLCGRVGCARGDCWPRYARAWDALLKATDGPVAAALWTETFRRESARWMEGALALFQRPPRAKETLTPDRTIAVVQAWGKPVSELDTLITRLDRLGVNWVLALDPVDQSWEPRLYRSPLGR
jgi:hypothetical protein